MFLIRLDAASYIDILFIMGSVILKSVYLSHGLLLRKPSHDSIMASHRHPQICRYNDILIAGV